MSEFGKKIKEIRKSKGLTLNQVALYSNISAAQLSRIENGKRGVPKPTTIKKIADALKYDYYELMEIAGYIGDIDLGEEPKKEQHITVDVKDLKKILEEKTVTWGDEVLTEKEKRKAIEILDVLLKKEEDAD